MGDQISNLIEHINVLVKNIGFLYCSRFVNALTDKKVYHCNMLSFFSITNEYLSSYVTKKKEQKRKKKDLFFHVDHILLSLLKNFFSSEKRKNLITKIGNKYLA